MPARLILLLGLALSTPLLASPATDLEQLVSEADAIVVVEIVSTDYTATAADGPMYAEAKVLKSVHGKLRAGRRFRFGASAWVGPSFQPGERRVVFLDAVADGDAYYTKTAWASLEAGKIDLFIAPEAVEKCTLEALTAFLRGLTSRQRPLKTHFK